jgi:cytochrome P450
MPSAAALADDPHPLLRELRERAPVAWVPEVGGWMVLTRELCLRVMRDAATFTVDDPRFSTARVVGPSMLSTDGAEHARHRAPFARAFRLDAVRAQLGPVVAAETEALLDAIAAGGEADLRRAFAGPLAAAAMAQVLGIDRPVDEVLAWYSAIVAAVDSAAPDGPVDPAGVAAFGELAAAIGPGLAVGGDLSREEATSDAAVLLFGGIDTTEGMLCNALWHLLGDPQALGAVLADPGLVEGAVEESLRLEPAAARVDRYATRDVELGGAAIARGDLVIVSVTAANRDPAVFADPDRFDPRRPDARRHLAFAAGPHVCLGMHLARLEAHVALRRVLERLRGLRLDPAHPTAPRGLVFRKPPALRVRWGA